jgi:hypothetical protein
MDCFAEPVITVRAQLRSSPGAHSLDPLARNDGVGCFHVIASEAKQSSFLAAADLAFDLDHGARRFIRS